jgi:WD40 repeat protein
MGAAPRLVVQTGHQGAINAVAYSPDGRLLVTGSGDSTLKLWDAASGLELRTFSGHQGLVWAVSFSPDGRTVAGGGLGETVKLWDVASGRELRTLAAHDGDVSSVAFSPDGKLLASADLAIHVWNLTTGQEVRTLTGYTGGVKSLAFSPNGKVLVGGGQYATVKLWDVASGRELRSLVGNWGEVKVAFSPNGRMLASASSWPPPDSGRQDEVIRLWDVSSGRELHTLTGHPWTINALAFSPDGKILASGGLDKTLKLWDTKRGVELRSLSMAKRDMNSIESLAFSPDGKTLATGNTAGNLDFWDVAKGEKLRTVRASFNWVKSLAVSPDGMKLAFGGYAADVKLWDLASGQLSGKLAGFKNGIESVAFSPDSTTLATSSWDGKDGFLRLWDLGDHTREVVRRRQGATFVAWSPDGKSFAFLASGKVQLLDMADGHTVRSFAASSNDILPFALSSDGKMLAAVNFVIPSPILLWDVASGELLHTLIVPQDRNFTNAVAFSPDGRLLASGGAQAWVRLWDVRTGELLRTLTDRPHDGSTHGVTAVAFSPDGKALVAANDDGTATLWDVEGASVLHTLLGHTSNITSVAFTPDGRTVVSGGDDDTVRFWRVSDGALLATLTSFPDGSWVVTDPQGRFDTADLESIPYLHWVLPDDPLTPLPLELFVREYFEPRLLARILNGEKLAPVSDLRQLNRVQPMVNIASIEAVANHPEWVDVKVEAQGAVRRYRDGQAPVKTAVHDLLVFRNGQLVGFADGKLADAGAAPFHRAFRVRLPAGGQPLRFTAYAFNDSRVKSATAALEYKPPAAVTTDRPRAYVITMGVNRPENPDWNLSYAANDARQMSEMLVARLRQQGRYDDVVPISLISDEASGATDAAPATKPHLQAVLDKLAGRASAVGDIPNAERLRTATPDDLVLISFSGHGINEGGQFYLIPSDTGPGHGRIFTPELRDHAISSDDLTNWLRDVDAGNMAMIIDACQSAASVGEDFKPGPMGARGLGQLAYEKGMRILAASQSEESALESSVTKHGLLSYALVTDGLERGNADYRPKDNKITLAEWLSYGVQRVPTLADEVAHGDLEDGHAGGPGTRGARLLVKDASKRAALQQPALFDYTKGRSDPALSGTQPGP